MDQKAVSPTYQLVKRAFLQTFLKMGSTTEYYEVLGLHLDVTETQEGAKGSKKAVTRVSSKSIKDNYERLESQYRNSKNSEEKQKYQLVIEAGHVLLDYHRRSNYDLLGREGLKVYEDPSYLTQKGKYSFLLSNFQTNTEPRLIVILFSLLAFLWILLQPALVANKFDEEYASSYTWVAIWTPSWVGDAYLFADSIAAFFIRWDFEEEDFDTVYHTPDPNWLKTHFPTVRRLLHVVLFIIFQAIVLNKADNQYDGSWWGILVPWYIYEIIWIALGIYHGFFVVIRHPTSENELTSAVVTATKEWDQEGGGRNESTDIETGGHESNEMQPKDESGSLVPTHHEVQPVEKQRLFAYYQDLIHQKHDQHAVFNSSMRLCLAFMLAAKLEGANFNWGITFWPVWVWLVVRNFMACHYAERGADEGKHVDFRALYVNGMSVEVEQVAKAGYFFEMVGNALLMCLCQVVPCFIFIGLACAFQHVVPPAMTVTVALFPFWFFFSLCSLCCACFCACGFCVSPETVDAAAEDAREKALATGAHLMEEAAEGGMEESMQGLLSGPENIDMDSMTTEQKDALMEGDFEKAGLTLNPMQAAMMKTMIKQQKQQESQAANTNQE